jgi:hypothetical protein
MRKLLTLLMLFVASQSDATVHRYFSNFQGSDNNLGTESSPWKSMNKHLLYSFTAETTYFHFRMNDVWYDTSLAVRTNSLGYPVIYTYYGGNLAFDDLPQINAGMNWELIPVRAGQNSSWSQYRGDTIWVATVALDRMRLFADTGTGIWEMPYCVTALIGSATSPDSISSTVIQFDTVGMQPNLSGSWNGRGDGWYYTVPNGASTQLYVYSPHINPADFYDSIGTNFNTSAYSVPLSVSSDNNIIVEYLEFYGGSQNANIASSTNITVRYCNFKRANMQGIYVNGGSNIMINNNFIDRVDTWQYSRNQSGGSGASFQTNNATNTTFAYNYCKDSKYEGWLLQGTSTGVQIIDNVFRGNGGDYSHLFGIESQAHHNYAAYNRYYKMRCRAQIYGNDNLWEYELIDTVLFPTVRIDAEDVGMGILMQGGSRNTFRNLTINNTYGVAFGWMVYGGNTPTGNVLERSIIVNSARYAGSFTPTNDTYGAAARLRLRNVSIWGTSVNELANNTVRYCTFYNDTGVTSRVVGLSSSMYGASWAYFSTAQVMASYSHWVGLQFTDPMFVDLAGGDYHLAEGSPCIDAGGTSPVPTSTVDYYGTSVPYNFSYDIGAAEYDATPPPDPPGPKAGKKLLIKAH